jgi:phosphoglycerate dehydrogenase-like enzyme
VKSPLPHGGAARTAPGNGRRHAEILISGWGCPRVDAAVLDAAPELRACIHAAGSVKKHLDPVVFERGLTVSSAADANAVPVAEYTVAALILGARRVFGRAAPTPTTRPRGHRPPWTPGCRGTLPLNA